jgi:hypothetical protein
MPFPDVSHSVVECIVLVGVQFACTFSTVTVVRFCFLSKLGDTSMALSAMEYTSRAIGDGHPWIVVRLLIACCGCLCDGSQPPGRCCVSCMRLSMMSLSPVTIGALYVPTGFLSRALCQHHPCSSTSSGACSAATEPITSLDYIAVNLSLVHLRRR